MLGGRTATYADVPRLPYTEMVVKESLRLYPPTWTLLPREAVEPVELGGYTIPRGSWVYTFPWVTHRDPRFFDDPRAVRSRSILARVAWRRFRRMPTFPFGGGPRVCIGNTFATMEMILIVASVLAEVPRASWPPARATSSPSR